MNKFGYTSTSSKGGKIIQAPSAIAFTENGDYNFKDHKLCNVKTPTDDKDAVNKKFLENKVNKVFNRCVKQIGENADVNKKVLEEMNKSLENSISSKVKDIYDDLHKLKDFAVNSIRDYTNTTANRLREVDDLLKKEIEGVNIKLTTLEQTFITNVSSEVAKFEYLLKNYMSNMVQNTLKPIENEAKKINDEIIVLKQAVTEVKEKYSYDDMIKYLKPYLRDHIKDVLEPIANDVKKTKDDIATIKKSVSFQPHS